MAVEEERVGLVVVVVVVVGEGEAEAEGGAAVDRSVSLLVLDGWEEGYQALVPREPVVGMEAATVVPRRLV
jgi:hypothetical protein